MSPEMTIALVTAGSGLLLLVGGLMVGRAAVQSTEDKRRGALEDRLKALRDRLQEAGEQIEASRDEAAKAKADTDRVRMEMEDRLSVEIGKEVARNTKLSDELKEANKRLEEVQAKLLKLEGGAAELKELQAKLAEVEAERDGLRSRTSEVERARSLADMSKQTTLQKELASVRDNEQKLRAELRERDQKLEQVEKAKQAAVEEADKARKDLEAAKDRIAVSERVMEGVRARSTMLSQELKQVKEELAKLKG